MARGAGINSRGQKVKLDLLIVSAVQGPIRFSWHRNVQSWEVKTLVHGQDWPDLESST